VSAAFFQLKDQDPTQDQIMAKIHELIEQGGAQLYYNESYIQNYLNVKHLRVRFEDMIQDTFSTVNKVLLNLGYIADKNMIRQAIQQNSFNVLSEGRSPGEENKTHHFRKGIVGDWKNYFTPEMNEYFCNKHKEIMNLWSCNEGESPSLLECPPLQYPALP
jgi:hypothetical protein